MSKVTIHNEEQMFVTGHAKHKAIHRLRRKESDNIKKKRFTAIRKNINGHNSYWIKDSVPDNEYITTIVPKKKVEKTFVIADKDSYDPETGKFENKIVKKVQMIPEHIERRIVKRDFRPIIPYLQHTKHNSKTSKYLKKCAAHKTRRVNKSINNEDFIANGNNCEYKRNFDIKQLLY